MSDRYGSGSRSGVLWGLRWCRCHGPREADRLAVEVKTRAEREGSPFSEAVFEGDAVFVAPDYGTAEASFDVFDYETGFGGLLDGLGAAPRLWLGEDVVAVAIRETVRGRCHDL